MPHGAQPQLDKSSIARLSEALLAKRRQLVHGHERSEDELDSIESEREIEWEELAQEEHAADVRTRISSQQYAQLRQIDGALERISRGNYGKCMDCGAQIPIRRLRAQPWAPYCADCTPSHEASLRGDGRDGASRDHASARPQDHSEDIPDSFADQRLAGTPLTPELDALDDAEIAEAVREAFATEVGEALEGVHVLCRDGVVILTGEVANDSLPEVARRIVEDEVGYEVVDRLMVTSFADGPERPESPLAREAPAETMDLDPEELEAETSEDILEVEEEGLTFVPPSRPVPER